jgi:hypothetical protein
MGLTVNATNIEFPCSHAKKESKKNQEPRIKSQEARTKKQESRSKNQEARQRSQ